jgi:hypothetical protein
VFCSTINTIEKVCVVVANLQEENTSEHDTMIIVFASFLSSLKNGFFVHKNIEILLKNNLVLT